MSIDDSTPVPRETIYTVLADRARLTPDGRLASYTGIGLLGIAAVLLVRPAWWLLLFPLVTLTMFGAWGITDRIVSERSAALPARGAGTTLLRAVKRGAAVIGTVSGVGTMLAGVAFLLGTWIS
jgi:hypothetical protein